MPKVIDSPDEFIVVGENIHATRVLLLKGKRIATTEDGNEVVPFKDLDDNPRHLTVPEWYKKTQPYEQGQIKHHMIAMLQGINGNDDEIQEGTDYICREVIKQTSAGAKYLDINVDEVSYDLEIQKRAMKWTVQTAQNISTIPLSIDSSNSEIIEAGLEAYDGKAGRPMINSVALERLDVLDMIVDHNAKVIVMATSGTAMPEDDIERVNNTKTIVEHVLSKGINLNDIFVDAIVFPISVDSRYGNHYLSAVEKIREIYSNEIHIGMGLSNVSFGMPRRKLINQTFIHLALQSGLDAGLIDPVQTRLDDVFSLDTDSEPVRLAMEMLLGQDDFCSNYLIAYRAGKLG